MPPINASMFISMFQPPYNPTLIYPSFQRLVIKMISSRIYSRGYAKHPCTQSACCQGFAVGPSQRYPLPRPSLCCQPINVCLKSIWEKNRNVVFIIRII